MSNRDLFDVLNHEGKLEYGTVIKGDYVRKLLGIDANPETMSHKEYMPFALQELAAMDYVRNILLGQGKYLKAQGGDYRILLPSENARQVDLYMSSADKKLRRALKLSRNMPKERDERPDQSQARAMLKREQIRQHRQQPTP